MKQLIATILAAFALTAFATDAPKAADTKPAVATTVKKTEHKPAKSTAAKDTKATPKADAPAK